MVAVNKWRGVLAGVTSVSRPQNHQLGVANEKEMGMME